MKKDKKIFKNNWLGIYNTSSHFAFTFAPASYFDNRWHIRFSIPIVVSILGMIFISMWFLPLFFIPWGPIYLDLPIRSKWDDCDPPEYGIAFHDSKIWFYIGGGGNMDGGRKWKTITMPWSYDWVRTSKLKKEAIMANATGKATIKANYKDWYHETQENRIDFYDPKMADVLWSRTYPYTYNLKSGKVQNVNATVKIEEREWRMKWLKWTPLFNKIHRDIAIEFDQEVGERSGSWKGGTLGCGYKLNPDESPQQSLRRMEKERKF